MAGTLTHWPGVCCRSGISRHCEEAAKPPTKQSPTVHDEIASSVASLLPRNDEFGNRLAGNGLGAGETSPLFAITGALTRRMGRQ